MKKKEIQSFNEFVVKASKITNDLKNAGSDVKKIISIANEAGYDFNLKDLEEIQAEAKTKSQSGGATDAVVGGVVVVGAVVGPPVVVNGVVAV